MDIWAVLWLVVISSTGIKSFVYVPLVILAMAIFRLGNWKYDFRVIWYISLLLFCSRGHFSSGLFLQVPEVWLWPPYSCQDFQSKMQIRSFLPFAYGLPWFLHLEDMEMDLLSESLLSFLASFPAHPPVQPIQPWWTFRSCQKTYVLSCVAHNFFSTW